MRLTIHDVLFLYFPLYTLHDLADIRPVQITSYIHQRPDERNIGAMHFGERPVRKEDQALRSHQKGQDYLQDLETRLKLACFPVGAEFGTSSLIRSVAADISSFGAFARAVM